MAFYDGREIGARIGFYRRANGWTMDDLASRTNGAVGKSVIANLETGRRTDLTVRQMVELSRALGVTPLALLLPLERPFQRELENGWSISVFTARAIFSGEQRWPQEGDLDAETPAGLVARRLMSFADQIDGWHQRINDAVDALATLYPADALRSVVAEPSGVSSDDATLREFADDVLAYERLRDEFATIGGQLPERHPATYAIDRRFGTEGGHGTAADSAR